MFHGKLCDHNDREIAWNDKIRLARGNAVRWNVFALQYIIMLNLICRNATIFHAFAYVCLPFRVNIECFRTITGIANVCARTSSMWLCSTKANAFDSVCVGFLSAILFFISRLVERQWHQCTLAQSRINRSAKLWIPLISLFDLIMH